LKMLNALVFYVCTYNTSIDVVYAVIVCR
jgi:hypothetical protein